MEQQTFDNLLALVDTLMPVLTAVVVGLFSFFWGKRQRETLQQQNEFSQQQASFWRSLLSPDVIEAVENMQANTDERAQVLVESGAEPERIAALKGLSSSIASTSASYEVLRERYPDDAESVTGSLTLRDFEHFRLSDKGEFIFDPKRYTGAGAYQAFTEEGRAHFPPTKPAEDDDEDSQ